MNNRLKFKIKLINAVVLKITGCVFFVLALLIGCANQEKENYDSVVEEIDLNITYLELGVKDIDELKIGDTLKNISLQERNLKILINGSDYRNYFKTKINGIVYGIGITEEKVIEYIQTTDKEFRTKEKLKVGDEYKKIKGLVKLKSLVHEPGWAIYQELNSNWNASLKIEDFDNIGELYNEERAIVSFFKR